MIGLQGPPRERFFAEIAGAPGAAFTACALLELQDVPLDAACYYTGDSGWFGLFDAYGGPRKTFHAVRAFRILLEMPDRVACSEGEPGKLAAAAGIDRSGGRAAVMVANFASGADRIEVALAGLPAEGAACGILVLDGRRDLEKVRTERLPGRDARLTLDLPAPAVALLRIGSPAR